MQDIINDNGTLLISKERLVNDAVFSGNSYRSQKCKGRFSEVLFAGRKYVEFGSLSPKIKCRITDGIKHVGDEYIMLMNEVNTRGEATGAAIELTAQSLMINEQFVAAEITDYINTHYILYTRSYMDLNLHSSSIKGYAKICAILKWIYDCVQKIENQTNNERVKTFLLRSFRINLLTALQSIELEIKIPLSETRFSQWFDDIISGMKTGKIPESIVIPKRLGNKNSSKVTEEQLKVALYWYINGVNMSIKAIYDKWLYYGKQKGWWLDADGLFAPPTESRLYQLIKPYKNTAYLTKTDEVEFRKKKVPSISRNLPQKKNHVWVIDGTAHNENVEYKNKVRQHVYAIKVADVATCRMVGAAPVIGVKEEFATTKEAILMGIKTTGVKPAIIQCDRGPAWKELEAWCCDNDIRLYPSLAGNARGKTIENMFYQFDNDITRYLKGYSGQNRTALSLNSRSSDSREMSGKRNSRSASVAMEWIKSEGLKLWNERIIKQLDNKPCNKTPMQLWAEKESYVPELTYEQLCVLCGTVHVKELTTGGLEIKHQGEPYTYFPPISTPEQREYAQWLFSNIPLQSQEESRCEVYVLEAGKPAAVFAHGGRFLGIWPLKDRVDFIAETPEQKELLSNYLSLQHRVREHAKQSNENIIQSIEMNADFETIRKIGEEALTGRKTPCEECEDVPVKLLGRYDKSALLADETEVKAQRQVQYKELIDPDTGEVIKIKIN
jgi:hypothetical protein